MNKLAIKSIRIEIEAYSVGHPPVCIAEPQKATIQYDGETYEVDVIFTDCKSVELWRDVRRGVHNVKLTAVGLQKPEAKL